ncbi:MAG: ATP synthase F0 subunit B [Deltaproteobacteria bacterium]|nr:MAG: ATP synthase F0 subunit B [Deltaproteobacteria bacterium]
MKLYKGYRGCIMLFTLFFLVAFPPLLLASTPDTDTGDTALIVDEPALPDDAHGQEAAGHQQHGNPLSQVKLQDFGWRIVNFIALMIILVKFLAKPIGNALSGRREKIVLEIEELEQKRADAEKVYQEFQDKLATVEADIDKIVERAVAQAEVEKKKILEKAEAAADELKRSAEQAVNNEIVEARKQLRAEVAEKAAVMAEEIVKKNLNRDDQKLIIENYLARVEAMS